jgi:hypothetical protein
LRNGIRRVRRRRHLRDLCHAVDVRRWRHSQCVRVIDGRRPRRTPRARCASDADQPNVPPFQPHK